MDAWTFMPVKRLRYLNAQRVGKLIWKDNKYRISLLRGRVDRGAGNTGHGPTSTSQYISIKKHPGVVK